MIASFSFINKKPRPAAVSCKLLSTISSNNLFSGTCVLMAKLISCKMATETFSSFTADMSAMAMVSRCEWKFSFFNWKNASKRKDRGRGESGGRSYMLPAGVNLANGGRMDGWLGWSVVGSNRAQWPGLCWHQSVLRAQRAIERKRQHDLRTLIWKMTSILVFLFYSCRQVVLRGHHHLQWIMQVNSCF